MTAKYANRHRVGIEELKTGFLKFSQYYYETAIINQSTESADGGGFLNFYQPLGYISSVLSFCSIFLDM